MNLSCKQCAAKTRNKTKINWPSTEQLLILVEEKNYRQVGILLGVSDNAVRKRIKNH
jgi:hypothetical protein